MHHIITLICNPANVVLDTSIIADLSSVLQKAGGLTGRVEWLNGPIAADLECAGLDPGGIEDMLRDALEGEPVDVVVHQADEQRRRKLLIADMDSTIITVECLDELADFAGRKAEVSAITERAMRGELVFEDALRERIAILAGLPQSALADTYAERVRLMPGARQLVRTMAAFGAQTILVSGGFTYFTERVAADAGFHAHRANRLIFENNCLTGVANPILGREAKLQALEESCSVHALSPDQALAVGDGANDLAMIQAAGMGIAFHAKPVVAAAARARIDHGDLTALLYLQGYRGSDFVQD
ncbi:MAG: phosphoserine phosphatase SerB [Alphaproteobacteria bacterium]|nr:phosphoserine phosphatase SerB [Alphaproteobacteria bacterium]